MLARRLISICLSFDLYRITFLRRFRVQSRSAKDNHQPPPTNRGPGLYFLHQKCRCRDLTDRPRLISHLRSLRSANTYFCFFQVQTFLKKHVANCSSPRLDLHSHQRRARLRSS